MTNVQKKHSINGFTLSEAVYPPGLKQPRHTHEKASFSFVLAGNYAENYGRRTPETRRASTIVFHPPQESHAVDFQSGAKILSVQFDAERFAYIRARSVILDASTSAQTETIARLGNKIYQEFRRMDAASGLAIEGLVYEILAESARSKILTAESKSPRWLEQAREFLRANYFETIALETVAEIALTAGFADQSHLARIFKNQLGVTPGEYRKIARSG